MTAATTALPAQDRLGRLFDERVRLIAEVAAPDTPVTVLVLLRGLDVADLVQGARAFAASLTEEEAGTWLRSWTRARFLFGNPANLPAHTPARVVAPAGTAGWLGPSPHQHPPGPSRLLKPLTGALPNLSAHIDVTPVAAGRRRRELHIATRDLTLVQYLVHLHHTVVEAVLLGRLDPAEPLRLVHRTDLDADLPDGEHRYARVHRPPDDLSALRLHTWLMP